MRRHGQAVARVCADKPGSERKGRRSSRERASDRDGERGRVAGSRTLLGCRQADRRTRLASKCSLLNTHPPPGRDARRSSGRSSGLRSAGFSRRRLRSVGRRAAAVLVAPVDVCCSEIKKAKLEIRPSELGPGALCVTWAPLFFRCTALERQQSRNFTTYFPPSLCSSRRAGRKLSIARHRQVYLSAMLSPNR